MKNILGEKGIQPIGASKQNQTTWSSHIGMAVDNSEEKASVASTQTVDSQTRLIKVVHFAYRKWAYFIVNHAWSVIFLCSLVTAICSVKVVLTPNENDITGYTPYGARSREELAIREEFFGNGYSGASFGAFILVAPKNGANLLDIDLLKQVVEVVTVSGEKELPACNGERIDDIVQNNISLYNHITKQNESFGQFCKDFCDLNQPVRTFYSALEYQTERLRLNESLHSRIQLAYPVTSMYGRKLNIQPNFYGISFLSLNNSTAGPTQLSNMKAVDLIALIYKAERVGEWSDAEVRDYEMSISDYFENKYHSDKLRVMSISTTYVTNEVVRAGMSMVPFLGFGFLIMVLCSSCTVLLSAAYMEQVSLHKITLAFMACVCPFMACGTALGLLLFGGLRYGSILCVTPFLVLAIGVDDAYLMIHAWQRVSRQMRRNPAKEDCVAYRLSMVLIETGPAILISALTNITADAVGSFTGSPEITLLCIGNMASLAVDFFYQVTFYSSVMAIAGFYEMRAEASAPCYKLSIPIGNSAIAPENAKKIENGKKKDLFKHSEKRSFHDTVQGSFKNFVTGYVNFITNTFVATAVFLFWIAFIAFSLVGISKFEVNLTTKRYLLKTHLYLRRAIIQHFHQRLSGLPKGKQRRGGARRNPANKYKFYGLKNLKSNQDGVFDVNDLENFLDWPEYSYWRGFLRLHTENNQTVLDSFLFTTAYHGLELRSWPRRSKLLQDWRKIIDAYPEFNASVYHEEGVFLDLIDNMPTDTWQSALATLVCMAAICFVFMYNTFTVLVASTIIASIITGMLGTLSWQGVSMDPIMMAATIISIGFSVDIPAHVSYHYHSASFEHPGRSVRDRLKVTLASVGFPAIQASLSTSLCVLSLLFVKLYMAKIFVQIMCLCILMCVLHSLVLLPAFFSLIEKGSSCFRRKDKQ